MTQPGQAPTGDRRRGRWRSGEDSRRRILVAARSCFGTQGYDRVTMRGIAAEARVDPAMLYYFFATKSQLFAAAMDLPADPAGELSGLLHGDHRDLGVRIVRHFLEIWDRNGSFEPLFALLRSAPHDQQSTRLLREYVQAELHAQLEQAIDAADAALCAQLMGTHLVGLALMRYVVRIEPLSSADPDAIAAAMGPAVRHYLDSNAEEEAPGSGKLGVDD